jgi:hypothetical protein
LATDGEDSGKCPLAPAPPQGFHALSARTSLDPGDRVSYPWADLPAMIGLVMLMGIVTKNSILLVDYAIMGREPD